MNYHNTMQATSVTYESNMKKQKCLESLICSKVSLLFIWGLKHQSRNWNMQCHHCWKATTRTWISPM